jgi:L-galactose dehydrogenase
MEYRILGRTKLRVSALGFGASPLGDVFRVTDPAEGVRSVHSAIDHGINFFDASPYYGAGVAEERLGRALSGKRTGVVLATKCGRYGASSFDFSAVGVRSSVEQSLRRLQTDYIDLLQVHDVEFGKVEQILTETLPTLQGLKESGVTRYIGITGYSLRTLLRIAEAFPIDTLLSYCRYNLLVDDLDQSLTPFAVAHQVGLINASPLHMGMLTESGAPPWHPAPLQVHEASRRALLVSARLGMNISEAALGFCLAHSYVSSTLIGMCTQREVQQNILAAGTHYDASLYKALLESVEPDRNVIWPSGLVDNLD